MSPVNAFSRSDEGQRQEPLAFVRAERKAVRGGLAPAGWFHHCVDQLDPDSLRLHSEGAALKGWLAMVSGNFGDSHWSLLTASGQRSGAEVAPLSLGVP